MHEIVCIDTPGLLRECGALIARGHHKGANNNTGDDSTATAFCAGGAIGHVTRYNYTLSPWFSMGNSPADTPRDNLYWAYVQVANYLVRAIGIPNSNYIPEWNDQQERTGFQVQCAFELAALMCEQDMGYGIHRFQEEHEEEHSEELVLA